MPSRQTGSLTCTTINSSHMYYHVFESLSARSNDVYSSAKEHLPMHTWLKQLSSQAIFGSSKCKFNLRKNMEGLSYSNPLGPSLQSISARELFQDLLLALQQIFAGHVCPWKLRLLGRGGTSCCIAGLLGILQCQPPNV